MSVQTQRLQKRQIQNQETAECASNLRSISFWTQTWQAEE